MSTTNTATASPCIYCGSAEPRTGREHVIPQGLGMFAQNWTLTDVCDACNQRFGRELDLHLTRDSFEAFLRVGSRLKPAAAAEKLRDRRIKGTLRATGPLDGARVLIKPTPARNVLVPVPPAQVGFRRPGEDWVFLTEPEWSKETIAAATTGSQVEVRVIAEAGGLDRLHRKLANLGVEFTETDMLCDVGMPEGRVQVVFDFLVDTTIRRAAAKIAFNYAAKVLGAEVVRRSDFDAIREFIRDGLEPYPLVSLRRWSPLVGPGAEVSQTHSCGIGWVPEQHVLVGLVCLFNQISYGVRLCRSDTDEWAHVGVHHLFDPFARMITQIGIAG